MAKLGDKSVCAQCGKPIVCMGEHWAHQGNWRPRHSARPVTPTAGSGPIASVASDWLIVRDVIARALGEMYRGMPEDVCERNAEAIIARLAGNNPPILLQVEA